MYLLRLALAKNVKIIVFPVHPISYAINVIKNLVINFYLKIIAIAVKIITIFWLEIA